MKKIRKIYDRYNRIFELGLYPLSLLILPLLNVNIGVDISDSTYSLGNYLFADRLEGMWVISTYLSNLFGSLIIKLPGANRLMGANIYTGLLLSVIALIVYYSLKKELGAAVVFVAEFMSISFCWIPTGILYNYLSYLLMAAGGIMLYKAIEKDNVKYLFGAGIILGANVFVRIPNLTQMALILVLWISVMISDEEHKIKIAATKTGVCVGGYVVGVLVPFGMVVCKYGFNGIIEMIFGLYGITTTDQTYTPLAMIAGTLKAYIRSAKWIVIIVAVMLAGIILFKIMPDKFVLLKKLTYICVVAVMVRFFWGRGMFSFRYYEDYSSMYEWGMVLLYMSIIVAILAAVNAFGNRDKQQLSLAVMSLVVIVIAPLGSNNYTYQNLNNLFLVLPLTVYMCFKLMKEMSVRYEKISFPIVSMIYVLLFIAAIQSFGFSQNFKFRDGMRGEVRDTEITGVASLEGMYTNKKHADSLMGLNAFISSEQCEEVILFGDCPGLTYVLNKPSALSTSWADLDSFPIEKLDEDLQMARENVPVILRNTDPTSISYNKKLDVIMDYIAMNHYTIGYTNDEFVVYVSE